MPWKWSLEEIYLKEEDASAVREAIVSLEKEERLLLRFEDQEEAAVVRQTQENPLTFVTNKLSNWDVLVEEEASLELLKEKATHVTNNCQLKQSNLVNSINF